MDVEAVGCNCEAVARASRRGDASSTVGTTVQGGAASGGRGLLGASSSSRQWRLVRHKVSWLREFARGCGGEGAGTCYTIDKVLMVVEQWWSAMDKRAVDGG